MLVGLSGAGKSTVGPLVASELGAEWVDLDREIEVRAGLTVSKIFATDGEEHFRALEQRHMMELLQGLPLVISSGGGWPTLPGNLAAAEPHAFIIYLSVSPETAATRLGAAGDRPLLAGATEMGNPTGRGMASNPQEAADPTGRRMASPLLRERLASQLAEREKWYRMAGIEIPADGPPDRVAAAVVTVARQYGGWP